MWTDKDIDRLLIALNEDVKAEAAREKAARKAAKRKQKRAR